jgi:hypothetical protein
MNTPDIDDDLEAHLPPRKGDVLFRGDLPDGMNNACLNMGGEGDSIVYTEGYRRGALRLVEYVVENQREQDFLVYPIIFLYRHHIELALKRIILRSPYLIERPLTEKEENHLKRHRLALLWQDLKSILSALCEVMGGEKLDTVDIEGIDSYIRQLSKLDSETYQSSAFR